MCSRPLRFAAVTIPKMSGNAYFGPVCAKRANLIEPKPRRAKATKVARASIWDPHPREIDPDQRDLWEAACAGPL
jgi:hypothetical protein